MLLFIPYAVIICLVTVILGSTASDLYSDLVRKYDADTFKLKVGRDVPHFVNFFAPWCGYCKRLKPVWDELAEKYNVDSSIQKLVIAKIDCTVDTPLCAEEGVSGYPSLIFYSVGSTEGMKYKGKRDLATLEEYISLSMSGKERNFHPVQAEDKNPTKGAIELTEETFHSTIDWGMHFVNFYVPFCGHCQKFAPVWDDLALSLSELDPSFTISKIDCQSHRLPCAEFELKGFPTILWIVNGKRIGKYQGDRTLGDLKRFITNMKQYTETLSDFQDGRIPENPSDPAPIVVQLTEANFENAISNGITFVKFFAPWCGHCRRLAPTWEELAQKLVANTKVKIAKVDCTTNEALCNTHKIPGYPTLFLFKNGNNVAEYNGIRDLESLHTFILDHLVHDEL